MNLLERQKDVLRSRILRTELDIFDCRFWLRYPLTASTEGKKIEQSLNRMIELLESELSLLEEELQKLQED